jgi:hypothetical protein
LPGRDFPVFSPAETDEILARGAGLERPSWIASLWGSHHAAREELGWSLLYLRAGLAEAAVGHGLRGLQRATLPAPELLATLGHAFYDRREHARAELCFRQALRSIDDPLARERLERLRHRR